MQKIVHIKGWQSWTPCRPRGFRRQCDYSPHNITQWQVPQTKKLKRPIVGWCSWYAFGSSISEKTILDNAKEFTSYHNRKTNAYILIDDGWTRLGDWTDCNRIKFPRGMKYVSSRIKTMRLKPGLWIAPFLVDTHSQYAAEHPDHLVRNRFGLVDGLRMLPFSIPFPATKAILDMEKPAVEKYIKNCISNSIENWGFELLKLDFLYSIYFNPRYKKSTEIPDQIIKNLLTFIKTTYPRVYTIGCGCPLGPAAGLVDAMRISSDIINPYLDSIRPINKIFHSGRLNDLKNNIKIRKDYNKVWNIDPDALVTRKSSGFTDRQVDMLKEIMKKPRTILFLGDDLTNK